MKTKSIFEYYFFGTSLRYLQDVQADWLVGDHPSGWGIRTNLSKFLEALEDLGLQVTSRACGELTKLLEELSKPGQGSGLSEDQARRLSEQMDRIRTTLDAELQGFEAYVVTPKRIDVARLLKDVPSLFSPGTFAKLPDIARYDLTEAGKCIAFERPTAAAFHLLRATEAILRAYYLERVHRNRATLMWGPMVADLRTRKVLKIPETLLTNLDDIRITFRNPTQHPEKVYDIDEVQDLWGRCTDVISRMARDFSLTAVAGGRP